MSIWIRGRAFLGSHVLTFWLSKLAIFEGLYQNVRIGGRMSGGSKGISKNTICKQNWTKRPIQPSLACVLQQSRQEPGSRLLPPLPLPSIQAGKLIDLALQSDLVKGCNWYFGILLKRGEQSVLYCLLLTFYYLSTNVDPGFDRNASHAIIVGIFQTVRFTRCLSCKIFCFNRTQRKPPVRLWH